MALPSLDEQKTRASKEKFYQAVGFHFSVHFWPNDRDSIDVRFQSVTGLDSTFETETFKEGGENRFEHVVPTRRKYGPLVLKRGMLGANASRVSEWLKRAFDNNVPNAKFEILNPVTIYLLSEEAQPLMSWTVSNVWPRSWKIGELNAERGEVLIETLELNYNTLISEGIATLNPPTPEKI
jgi:phage tail-like protein